MSDENGQEELKNKESRDLARRYDLFSAGFARLRRNAAGREPLFDPASRLSALVLDSDEESK